ncbi:MAG: proline racemase family protein [Spirochaetota bacterium]|nr:MAG: proline racemase family protein [Spirochaetota bacterium]
MKELRDWLSPENWKKIKTIDCHTAGEPLRIITDGFPEVPGATILKRRQWVMQNNDNLRTTLMWEPRGHADMYGCILTPPVTEDADIGILFMHNEGYSTMCGHGIIGIATVILETGMFPMREPESTIKLDTPAGLVTAHARVADGKVKSVYFRNVPSFVLTMDEVIDVPDLGKVKYDIAFGGAFYAYVNAENLALSLSKEEYRELIEKGMAIKRAIMSKKAIIHPFEKDLNFLYGTIFFGPPHDDKAHSRNVCIFAEGEVDRSPTGTGVSGRLALQYARGEIELNQAVITDSIIGSRFSARVIEQTTFGPHQAVIPEVEGTAHITGRHEFLIDPDDPLGNGFILR